MQHGRTDCLPHEMSICASLDNQLSLLLITSLAFMQVHKAVITETKKEFSRKDGSTVKFDRNSCVLINANGAPLGTRVLGFATHELRARNMIKILSLAVRVI